MPASWCSRAVAALVLLATLGSLPALAQYWSHYANARFGYELDIPPDFAGQGESDNGDGQVFLLPNGRQELRVWGGWALDGVEAEATGRIAADMDAGWTITSQAQSPDWAVWAGTRAGQGAVSRLIALCEADGYAMFRMEFPREQMATVAPVLEGITRSFVATPC